MELEPPEDEQRIRPRPTPGFGIPSQRRDYQFVVAERMNRGDEEVADDNDNGSGAPPMYLVQSCDPRGNIIKQRPLSDESGLFTDRPRPEEEPPRTTTTTTTAELAERKRKQSKVYYA